MKPGCIEKILDRIRGVSITVLGDFCLDAYWMLDPRGSEVSIETGLPARAVGRHYYTLGGGANIVANLAALEPARIRAIGVVGDDVFGRELTRQLELLGVETASLVIQKENFDTVTFGKPYLAGAEQPRIDFGFFNRRSRATDDALIAAFRNALETVDAVILNQQVPGSITNSSFIDRVNSLLDEFTDKVVLLDSRHYGGRFRNVYRRTNDLEAALLNGADVMEDDVVPLAELRRYVRNLHEQSNKPVFVTRGARGVIVCDASGVHEVPGLQLLGKVDPVGAGDTTISALGCCLAAKVPPVEAAQFANFAASVTVQKLFGTGAASGAEILEIGRDPDYIYQPELATDRRGARCLDKSEIELCYERAEIPLDRARHVIFDHDGTVSTLRQGWEKIMEPMWVRAILGRHYDSADETLYHKTLTRVREYIDKSTGIQTILQMDALVEMVREAGVVPPGEVRDAAGYKEIYNDALMKMVSRRLAKLRRGELSISDYTIKGAVSFLNELRKRDITLYLVSGTDQDDVIAEAEALGYADLFDGGIYGALGDVKKYSKKIVIERIMEKNKLEGAELAVLGDGPVEMREARKRDGLAVGIASDEIRRHGLNFAKRTRLVRAGAHVIAPDFSQGSILLDILLAK